MVDEKYTVVQLKATLKQLNLPQSGDKATLIKRLWAHDPSGAWKNVARSVQMDEETRDHPLTTQDEESDDELAGRTENRALRTGIEADRDSLAERDIVVGLSRDIERMRRENELMQGQLEDLRLERNRTENMSVSTPATSGLSFTPRPTITVLAELLNEFTGAEDTFQNWQKQLKLVRTTYNLDDNNTRILISMKLKHKALQWFRSKPEHLEISIMELIDQMKRMFDHRPAKLELRRRFEKRTWQNNESFCNYFYDKTILAGRISVSEEELIDFIIDGIPEAHLRNQARMHRFEGKEDLLKAFEQITLRPENKNRPGRGNVVSKPDKQQSNTKNNGEEQRREIKCYNCNKTGHLARNCDKPKRERGSCYECGSTDHRARDCSQKKQKTSSPGASQKETDAQISNVSIQHESDNEYFKPAKIRISSDGSEYNFTANSQLDTACPISFIKTKLVPPGLISQLASEHYEGINKSVLEIQGAVIVSIELEDAMTNDMIIRVVPDHTMRGDLILGRDALKKLGYTVAKPVDVKNVDKTVNEVLNIEAHEMKVSEIEKLDVNPKISYEIKNKFMEKFQEGYVQAKKPLEPKVRAELKLHVKEKQPFHFAPTRLSVDEKNKVRVILDELIERGIIRSSSSEYASRIVLVRKKDGNIRMCVDYRTLNKVTARDNYPLPIIEEQINALQGKRYFTSLDLKDGFHHVYVEKDSIKYTAFITPFGQYEYVKMPFGLKNAPSRFQRFVNEVLHDLIRSGDVVVYMDDFLVATETIEKHLEVLNRVFQLLVENKLELRLNKCRFLYEEIQFLGYTITTEGIRPTDFGIMAIKEFPTPRSARDVQRFLGMCSYFRKFVKDFSLIARPLYDLVKKETFEFGPKQKEVFELLKSKLISMPILSIYSPRDETELHCDASSQGFGAVLLQRKMDKKFHPIFYFSKKTSNDEARYHSYELETLAIIYALRRFRIYLQGIPFKIVTDCNALVMTLNKKDINPRIARWALELQNYDYSTEHRPGKRMQHVDALSRANSILVVEANTFEFELAVCQKQDPVIQELRTRLEKKQDSVYELRNGLVYRKDHDQVLFFVPHAMEQDLLHKYHNDFGHFGVDKTLSLLQETYWFPNMKSKVRNFIENCTQCIAFSRPSGKVEGFMHSIPKGNEPFITIHVDHYGPVDRANTSKKYVLLVVDAFTKFVKLYAVKTTTSRETIRCLKDYFYAYSKPKTLISDRGTSFTSEEFGEFIKENNVNHVKVATASPQANGQVERYNRMLGPALGKLYNGKDWYKSLGEIEFAINNTVNRATGETPSRLLFGVSQRGHVYDALKEYIVEQNETGERDLSKMRANAAEKIERTREYNEQYTNRKRKVAREYSEGDLVMVKNFEAVGGKLTPAYRGPYRVIRKLRNDRYVVADVEGCQVSQRPYQGTWEVANMKPWRKKSDVEDVYENDSETDSEEID